jgi:hypothetical protein
MGQSLITEKFMWTLEAYFDETGHGSDIKTQILGIAGCLTASELWRKIEKQWENALREENLPYFHMREYAHSQGVFKTWKGDENRRRKIYGKLWEIISNAGIMPLGCFVQLNEFKQELQGQEHHVLKDAYYLCYMGCLRITEQLLDFQQVAQISTYFDDKKDSRTEASNIFNILKPRYKGRIPFPEFRNMRNSPPLQIADIIAYESKKEFERQLNKQSQAPRWGFSQLEVLITPPFPNNEPVLFGSKNCSIGLLSRHELAHVSKEQKRVYED